MKRLLTEDRRLVASSLIDWIGTGFYLAVSAIYLTRVVGLSPSGVGLALAAAGLIGMAGSVPVARLGDRHGHRVTLILLHLSRAAAFAGLAFVDLVPATIATLGAIALADQASSSVTQALADDLAGPAGRVALMARLRVVTNIGITLGTVPAGIALAAGTDALSLLLVANAASYLGAAAVVATLPRRAAGARPAIAERGRLLVPSPPTTALIGVDGLLSLWNVMLNVGLPLWILQATAAPPALVALLYGTNTVLVIVLQGRVSRAIASYLDAARAQRLSGLLLAAASVCLAAAVLGGRATSTAILCVAVLCLTLGELLKVSAAWQITFALAPAGRAAEFFATYGLGKMAFQVCGPVLITAGVLALGSAGWLLLALAFVVGGAVTPAAARGALARPVARRRGSTRRGMGGRAAGRDHRRMVPIRFIRLATLCVAIMCGAGSAQLAGLLAGA